MAPPFFLVLLLIVLPMVVSANAPVFLPSKPKPAKRHKPIKRRTFLA